MKTLKQRSISTPPSSRRVSKIDTEVVNVHQRLYSGSTVGTRAKIATTKSSKPLSTTPTTTTTATTTTNTPSNTLFQPSLPAETHQILFSPQSNVLKRSGSAGQLDMWQQPPDRRTQSAPRARPKALTFALQEKSQALQVEQKKEVVVVDHKKFISPMEKPARKIATPLSVDSNPTSHPTSHQTSHPTKPPPPPTMTAEANLHSVKKPKQKRPAQTPISADKLSANKAAKRATMAKITATNSTMPSRYANGTASSQNKLQVKSPNVHTTANSATSTTGSISSATPKTKNNSPRLISSRSTVNLMTFDLLESTNAPTSPSVVNESLNQTHYADEILRVVEQCDHQSPKVQNYQSSPKYLSPKHQGDNYDAMFDDRSCPSPSLSAIETNSLLPQSFESVIFDKLLNITNNTNNTNNTMASQSMPRKSFESDVDVDLSTEESFLVVTNNTNTKYYCQLIEHKK